MSARILLTLVLLVLLAGTHFVSYRSGRAVVSAAWAADKLAAGESARQKEKALTLANQGIDNALQIDKSRRAAAERVIAGRLRDLQAAVADKPDDTPAVGGVDDPRDAIIRQCASALAGLDAYAAGVAGTATALQGYARDVCLSGDQPRP